MGAARKLCVSLSAGLLAVSWSLPASAASSNADYVALPGASFISVLPQGNTPGSAQAVDIAPFRLRRTPVSTAEFQAFVSAHPQWQRTRVPAVFADARYLIDWRSASAPQAQERPQVNVSWFAAKAFCDSEGARLPTWLEWEYAAAADETRRDARADPQWRAQILSWYSRPNAAVLPAVGGSANSYGVSDLHGLVWEWVEDFNALFIAGDSRTQGDPDLLKFCGTGPLSVLDRDSYAVLMRIALLSSLGAADTTGNLGFRCARPALGGTP